MDGTTGTACAERATLICGLEQLASAIRLEDAPALLGDLERVRWMLRLRLENHNGREDAARSSPDQVLDVNDAAIRLGCSTSWLYRNYRRLGFGVHKGRSLGFSAKGIDRFIHTRQGR